MINFPIDDCRCDNCNPFAHLYLPQTTKGGVTVGETWVHHSGREYRVIGFANLYSINPFKFPIHVLYAGTNNRVWTRPLTEFLEKFMPSPAWEAKDEEVVQFSDEDLPLPEDAAIQAAHPLNTNRFDLHAEAQRLVSAKHSKFALVDMVNWLLSRIEPEQDEPVGELVGCHDGYGTRIVPETPYCINQHSDKLRKAAEEVVASIRNEADNETFANALENLRAVLEEEK